MRRACPALVTGMLLLAAPPLAAQLRLSGSASGFMAQHHVRFADSVLERTGFWFGVEGVVQVGRLRAGVGSLIGSLSGDDQAVNPDADVRVTHLELHLVPNPAIALGVQYEVKRFESELGVTLWTLMGVNARLTPPLGGSGLSGLAEVTYFVSGSVVDGESISPAMRGTFGVTWRRAGSPVTLRLAYRFERFDFAAAGTAAPRLEQFRGAVAGIGLQLGR